VYSSLTTPATTVKAGVGVIIVDDSGRVLLERRRDNGMWGLVGGGVDPGESVGQAAVREALEETGLTIAITGLVGVYSDPGQGRIVTYPDNGDSRHLVDTVVTAKIVSGVLVVSEESLELAFFADSELPTDLVPPAREPLSDFFAGRLARVR
jgi:8-oxo-dGTP pyrophosphatase MutT (NUDIX family)